MEICGITAQLGGWEMCSSSKICKVTAKDLQQGRKMYNEIKTILQNEDRCLIGPE